MTSARRRRWPWLVAALTLLVAGAWIAGLGDLTKPLKRTPIVMPHRTDKSDRREKARVRMLPLGPVPGHPGKKPPRSLADPLLTALGGNSGAMVFEANALWNEPVGQMLLKCLESRAPGFHQALDQSRSKFHFDPLQQIDRMGVSPGHEVAFSGFFKGVDFDQMFPGDPRAPYGDHAVIYEPPPGAGPSQPYVAVWNDQLLLVGQSEAELQHTVDQLEGRAPRPAPAVSLPEVYGDGYGDISGSVIAKVLRQVDPQIADRIANQVSDARIHFDASGDVTLDAKVWGHGDLGPLERTILGALSAARVAAEARGDTHLADILDDATVMAFRNAFDLRIAVPESWVKSALGNCEIFGPPPHSALVKPEPAPAQPPAGR